jgi:subtilase family serine protease
MNERRAGDSGWCCFGTQLVCSVLLLFSVHGFGQQRLHKHVPAVVSNGQAEFVAKLPSKQTVDITILLPLRNQAELSTVLNELYDPSSPQYRQFLTVEEFTDRFGPTEKDCSNVIQWSKDQGFTIKDMSTNRRIINVSGTVEQIDASLNVAMNKYLDKKQGRTFYSIDREPTLSLDTPVAHIQGLNNYSVAQPMVRVKKNAGPIADVTGSGPGGYYLASDMRAAYYGGSFLTGAGQCVGLFEFGGYRLNDVNMTFANAAQSYNVPINNVLVNVAYNAVGSDDSEQVLDIVQAIGMAPGLSQVRVYIGRDGDDFNVFNAMATENVCKQLSVSWSWIPDDSRWDDPVFQEFAAQGQSVFVASGDYGAYDLAVSPYVYPGEDPYVTAVGGTHLDTVYSGGPWVSESVWNNPPSGSGGGVSPDDVPIPSWQQGVPGSTSYRNVPDVAMEADNDSYFCDLGSCGGGAGGTSFAAPRWAAFMALVNQQAVEAGTAPKGGIGFINPAIYAIGQSANYTNDFHDVTVGDNDSDNQLLWYGATAGYDLTTGWGSPNGQNLINALAGSIRPGFWLTDSPASLSVSQGSSVTSTVSVTDVGGFAGTVNLAASALPTGVTASFSPTSTAGSSLLTLTASSAATFGSATVKITGTSGALSAATYFFITVNSAPVIPPPVGVAGSVNVGSSSGALTETLTFTTAGTLGSISVLTTGIPNLDFANGGGGTCTIGKSYKLSATCTVRITFSPRYAGVRNGAVVLTDAAGNQFAKLYITGTGIGPQAVFTPGTQTPIGNGLIYPEASATLADGSVYLTDYGTGANGALYLEKLANGVYTQSNTNCGLKSPTGVAVDGSGAIYVGDPGWPGVYKITLVNGTCTKKVIGYGIWTPWGVAVDPSGDVYVTDLGLPGYAPTVYKEILQADGTYVQSTIGSGWVAPFAIAVDANGNVDVADYTMPGVFMESPSGGSYTQSAIGQGWTAPSGIAIDGAGQIYVSDSGSIVYGGEQIPAVIYKEVLSQGSWVQSAVADGWVIPRGISVDASGNLYVPDQTRGVFKLDLVDPPTLGFANAVSGTASSDSPKTLTVSNAGTAPLQFSLLTYPNDFPEMSGIATDCTSNSSVPQGGSCTLSVEFLPRAALGSNATLPLSENLNVSTNDLNTVTHKAIPVSGTEIAVTQTAGVSISVFSNPTAAGSPLSMTVSLRGPSGGPIPTGSVSLYNGATLIAGPLSVTNGSVSYNTSSFAVGTYSVTASYTGDGNYLASSSKPLVESIVPGPGALGFDDTGAGTQNVGTTGSAIPLTVTFNRAATLGNISVLTQGITNLDFSNAGGGSCSVGTSYAANTSCTINIAFTPHYSGARSGAIVLYDSNGTVIGTGYLQGIGVGPQMALSPGTMTSISTGMSYPAGTAVDDAGNVYVADVASAVVYKETFVNGTYTQSTVGNGFSEPYSVAIDGAGNVYIADCGTQAVYKEVRANSTYTQVVIGSGLVCPMGVAVDASGKVYVADFGDGRTAGAIYLEAPLNGTYTQSAIGSGFVTPTNVAVDELGKVYVADPANGNGNASVYKLAPTNGSYSQTTIGSGWLTPTSIAVDGNSNLLITDDAYGLGDGFIEQETLKSDGTYSQSTVTTPTPVPFPGGISIDGKGNLYLSDSLDGVVFQYDVFDPPPLSFANTAFGSTSVDSPRIVSVKNAGNANLTISGLTYPMDFPQKAGSSGECTSSTSLGAGASCTLSIAFTPVSQRVTQAAILSETLDITSDSLNAPSITYLNVSGTEGASAATLTVGAIISVATVGSSVTFSAMAVGQTGGPTPTGSVTFYENGNALGSVSLNNGTAGYSINFTTVGNYGVSAVYGGDENYPSATSNTMTEQVIPASTFGTQNVATSTSQTFTVTFASRVTLGSVAVVTQGIANLDFTNAGGGTCTVGTLYNAAASCTVKVSFKPLYAGTRQGAIVVGDSNGNLVQTIFLQGTGIAPQLTFSLNGRPGIVKSLGIGPSLTNEITDYTVDDAGNIYILAGQTGTSSVTKWTASGASYTPTTVPTSSLTTPLSIAVDSSGSVYVIDGYVYQRTSNNCRLIKETLIAGTYKETVVKNELSTCAMRNMAIDGLGNVYISNGTQVLKETRSGNGYVESALPTGTLYGVGSVTVDGTGNVFLQDSRSGSSIPARIMELSPTSAGNYTVTILQTDLDITVDYGKLVVDRTGGLYVYHVYMDPQTGFHFQTLNLVKLIPSGSGYVSTVVLPGELQQTGQYWSLGIDGYQNLYTLNLQNTVGQFSISKFDFGNPPSVSYGPVNIGRKGGDSPQSVTLTDVGNAPLTIAIPSAGTNPSVSPGSFALDSLSTCPQVTSGPAGKLPPGSSCSYVIDFSPTTTGVINGSMLLTDDAFNATVGRQTIPLSGTGNAQAQTVLLTRAADGSQQARWLPLGSNPSGSLINGIWIDSDGPTWVVGAAEFVPGTCTEIESGRLEVMQDVLAGKWSYDVRNVTLPNTQCSNNVYRFSMAYSVWNSGDKELQDPFVLGFYVKDAQGNDTVLYATISSNTESARIDVTPATQNSSGQLTATASLMNAPSDSLSLKWTILGTTAIEFSNHKQTIEVPYLKPTLSSPWPSIQIMEPSPTGNSVSFTLKVEVTERLAVGTQTLEYGPTPEGFCGSPTITSISPNAWFAGRTYGPSTVPVTITGMRFNPSGTQSCPITVLTAPAALGLSNVTVVDQTHILASVSPLASAQTQSVMVTAGTSSITGYILGTPVIQQDLDTGLTNVSLPANPPPAVIGQQIHLKTAPNQGTLPGGLTTKSSKWTLSGTNVKGYSITYGAGNDATAAQVQSIQNDDLGKDEITFYWVKPANPLPITFTYCVNIAGLSDPYDCSLPATAQFNVQGPTGDLMISATMPIDGSGVNDSRLIDGNSKFGLTGVPVALGTVGIDFNSNAIPVPNYNQSFTFVQKVSDDKQVLNSLGARPPTSESGLDNTFPYAYVSPNETYDAPGVLLPDIYGESWETFTATMYLMWDPALPSGCAIAKTIQNGNGTFTPTQSTCTKSIPVPLSSVTWHWSGCTINTLQQQTNRTTWIKSTNNGCPVQQLNPPQTDWFPTWDTVVHNP